MAEQLKPGQVPREVFEMLLEHSVFPTFDLVIEIPGKGVLLVYRKIAPYKDTWALPGLRQYKGERITDVLARIGRDEAGLQLDVSKAEILGQFDGVFSTEHSRQDMSTGYLVKTSATDVNVNAEHFSRHQFITEKSQIPDNIGAMYKHYLNLYFDER